MMVEEKADPSDSEDFEIQKKEVTGQKSSNQWSADLRLKLITGTPSLVPHLTLSPEILISRTGALDIYHGVCSTAQRTLPYTEVPP
jgi:hypothetical protein